MEPNSLTYKIASEPEEMEQIYQLNYETFVEEIPQHQQNRDRRLIDKFDRENVYIIAKDAGEVIGMIAVRGNRPFSLDYKLDDLDYYLPAHANPCEVRLLSVKKNYRKTRVFFQLVNELVSYCLGKNYNMALISGTDRQINLYRKIGFEPFGPMVGKTGAMFQPMYLTLEKFETSTKAFTRLVKQKKHPLKRMNFLPGPVEVKKEVEYAFRKTAISHRSDEFSNEMNAVRAKLCELVNANHAQIVIGTGTLANDLVGAQLKKLPGKGLVLANGEFGYRLMDHADRLGLKYYKLAKQWNERISIDEIEGVLNTYDDIDWIWTVHCETSTGYLYDLNRIIEVAKKHQLKVSVDACSSVGIVPIDLKDVYLASTVSGKGLGSYPGLAIVFHQEAIGPDKEIPRYLDLGQYASADSVPYTHSSNLLSALHQAVKQVDFENRHTLGHAAKRRLSDAGFTILGNEMFSPGIVTIALPDTISSKTIGDQLKEKGIMVSYESSYLMEKNWIQFAFMGDLRGAEIEAAIAIFEKTVGCCVERV
ncbi:aminotransferase class V-fold PLP-dependent enzyme [Bacillus sp. FJAT-27251]|uniref:aminotransferase class V-fold PLP-dependent enzyme n=1 Tax=Bacillus sp. FJAT-27251 TaxID=1684142 RepID=UPI0006A76C5E|nr:aminotransferase class V-fold PLP-dependent enzyme [Bacillus sp. FJAT-27251]